eukprot:scaffold323_cov91-Cyclotella_meneghiniana.AAC.8
MAARCCQMCRERSTQLWVVAVEWWRCYRWICVGVGDGGLPFFASRQKIGGGGGCRKGLKFD